MSMTNHTETLCELWDESPLISLPHSTLYHLDPIGMGTPFVESLTSYIARLACAHSVQPNVLVSQAIVPLLDVSSQGRQPYARRTSFWAGSAVLNGMTPLTCRLVQVLSDLTLRHDLHFLTMLTWKEVLPQQHLVRRTRAWCAACLEEWRERSQVVYEPLLWAFEAVHRCPVHECFLQSTCPHCARTQFPLTPRAQPGYCASCERWVGSRVASTPLLLTVPEEERRWHSFVEIGVGELVAVAPHLTSSLSRNTIAVSVEKVMNGNQLALARRLHVTQASVWKWLTGGSLPQLGTLLHICFHLDVSALAFLTGAIQTHTHQREQEGVQPMKKPGSRPYKKFDVEHMRHLLEAVLRNTDEPPLSMADIVRDLGYDQANFRKYFPELSRTISKRYMDYLKEKRRERIQTLCDEVRQATLSLHAQGCYPGNRQVAKLLRKPTSFMEPEVQLTWRQTVKELGVKPMR